MITRILLALAVAFGLIAVPSVPVTEAQEWDMFHTDAFEEYADEFTALFNSIETKWSKNGRLMIRVGDTGSFKFAKKG